MYVDLLNLKSVNLQFYLPRYSVSINKMEEITTILRQSNEVLGTIDLNIANNFVNIASGIQNDITFFQNDNTDKIMVQHCVAKNATSDDNIFYFWKLF